VWDVLHDNDVNGIGRVMVTEYRPGPFSDEITDRGIPGIPDVEAASICTVRRNGRTTPLERG
jgi:hypothetical protein